MTPTPCTYKQPFAGEGRVGRHVLGERSGRAGDGMNAPTPIPTVANQVAELEARLDQLEAARAQERIEAEFWASMLTATIEKLHTRLQIAEARLDLRPVS